MTDGTSLDLGSIRPGTHICFIYDSADQRLDALGRVMAGVLRGGGSTTYFACRSDLDVIRDHLSQRGVPPHLLEEPTFAVRSAHETYTPDGRFSRQRMLDRLADTYECMQKSVDGTVFFTGEMEWALQTDLPGRDQLVAYERAVNLVIRRHPFSAICQYDARAFDGDLLFEIVKAHPLMLVRNQILANPYYEAPAEAANSDCACGSGHGHGRAHG